MDKFKIEGGHALEGEMPVSGSKNSALPALALFADGRAGHAAPDSASERHRHDGETAHYTGRSFPDQDGTVCVAARSSEAGGSSLRRGEDDAGVEPGLGPLVARTGRARVSMPGGCAIGARPINLHVSALETLGHTIEQIARICGSKSSRWAAWRPTYISTESPLQALKTVLMAAVLARGETVIRNAAREPEVKDLADLLIKMGAEVEGAGTSIIRVKGVERLHGAEHTIIPDRIEAGTFLLSAAICKGDVLVSRLHSGARGRTDLQDAAGRSRSRRD